jgi:hypothetical protein
VTRFPFISLAALLAMAACGARDPVDKKAAAANAANLPDVNVPAPSATGAPRGPTVPAHAPPAPAAAIPAALQGRWGLTPADCTAGRSDAKGLLTITADNLRFYESRAVPAADVEAGDSSISGNFAYTGEGQSWTKYESLKVDKGRLTRTETKPTVSFSYAKCG